VANLRQLLGEKIGRRGCGVGKGDVFWLVHSAFKVSTLSKERPEGFQALYVKASSLPSQEQKFLSTVSPGRPLFSGWNWTAMRFLLPSTLVKVIP
jgi:hypothetical protein